jgi:proline iminopeptidase
MIERRRKTARKPERKDPGTMYVTVNGARLYFDVDGEALTVGTAGMHQRPTVILLHGGPGADHAIHKPAFKRLTALAQVIYLDHRGNGRSQGDDPADWTLAQWADDLHDFCRALGIHRPVVLGTSFGGFVAQAYAASYPDHPAGLILVSTAARMDFPAVFAAFDRLAGPEAAAVAEDYWTAPTADSRARYRDICLPHYTLQGGAPAWLDRVIFKNDVALHFNGPANEHGAMDFRAALGAVPCPVLVMAGEQDPITPPEFSESLKAALPGTTSRLVRIDRAGHGIVADQPERFFAEIEAFLAALPPASDQDGG